MKKGLFVLLLLSFFSTALFIISCQHEPPIITGCTGNFHLTYVSTPDTTNNGYADGTITAGATVGATITYSLDGGAAQSSGYFTGLTANQTYKIVASNELGCKDSVSVTIRSVTGGSGSPCPTITVTATGSNPTSSTATNGSISASATGGVAPYTYSINGGAYGTSSTFTGLATGNYTIQVKDANNCPGTSSQLTLSASGGGPCPTILVTGTPISTSTICALDGTITVSASGGVAPYTYSKNGTTFQTSNSFTGLAVGAVTITVKDANGCTGSASISVTGPATVHFATDIQPTISSTCGRANIGCHSHSNSWTTYSDIVGTSSGTTWTNNLNTFLKRIRSTNGSAVSQCPLTTASGNHDMPPSSSTSWTNFVKTALTNWIDQGYPNN